MDLILLPGSNPLNQEWIEEVESNLKPYFNSTQIQYYDHWEGMRSSFTLRAEQQKLAEIVDGKNDIVVFAKSVGVHLSVQSICSDIIKPKACIFVGTPRNWKLEESYDIPLIEKKLTMPVLFIQQELDRFVFFKELETMLKTSNLVNYRAEMVKGSDHQYADIAQLAKLVKGFLDSL